MKKKQILIRLTNYIMKKLVLRNWNNWSFTPRKLIKKLKNYLQFRLKFQKYLICTMGSQPRLIKKKNTNTLQNCKKYKIYKELSIFQYKKKKFAKTKLPDLKSKIKYWFLWMNWEISARNLQFQLIIITK